MKKVLAIAVSVFAVASMLVAFQITAPSSSQDPASALSGSQFDAGNIISDANFYDGDSMSESQIQAFLSAQIGTCSNGQCLNVGRYSMNSRPKDAMCNAVTGGSSLSAAQIIARVGAACSISPKVIIVTLQKEQTIVNGSRAKAPSAATLERAMGYACPDNAQGKCDPAYAGVGNQVYWAAWQWKRYGNPAGTSNYFTWFAPGGNRQIQYNVPVSCGTKTVYVQNRATAALYYYTPYTPNQAALNNLYGSGDGCSAYGNRNFWRLYTDWFGSTTQNAAPYGALDSVTGGGEVVTVGGWAIDPLTSASTQVDVYVDSVGTRISAAANRPDVGRAHPGFGNAHGYSASVTASPGTHKVCVYALSVDGYRNTALGCKTVSVVKASPFGSVNGISAVPGGLRVNGWAIDPNQIATSLSVQLKIDGQVTTVTANGNRSDVSRAYPGAGARHGFDKTVAVQGGTHTVCVTGVNVGAGADKLLAPCSSVRTPGSVPTGSVDKLNGTATGIEISGWTVDGDTTASIPVDVYVDGSGRRITANQGRSDIGRLFPVYGSAHGFSTTIAAKPGPHNVCVYAINAGAGSTNPMLRCATVQVGNAPIGGYDAATAVAGGIAVSGWAWDPDSTALIPVDVYVDGSGRRIQTGARRTDVGRAHPGAGNERGFAATIPASSGQHQVCLYAIDANGGANTALGCKSVTVA